MLNYPSCCAYGIRSENREWVLRALEDSDDEKTDSWHGKRKQMTEKLLETSVDTGGLPCKGRPPLPYMSQPGACDKVADRRSHGVCWCQRVCRPTQHRIDYVQAKASMCRRASLRLAAEVVGVAFPEQELSPAHTCLKSDQSRRGRQVWKSAAHSER